jgi:hypothetical protein
MGPGLSPTCAQEDRASRRRVAARSRMCGLFGYSSQTASCRALLSRHVSTCSSPGFTARSKQGHDSTAALPSHHTPAGARNRSRAQETQS